MAPIAALVALAGATFCFVTGENLPVALLPLLSSGLRVSLSTVGLLVTVYAGVVIVVSAPLTRLTRQLPRRLLLSALVAVFALTTLAAAVVPSYGWMVAVRVGTALAQAIFWSIVAVVAVGLLPPSARGRAIAFVFVGSSVAVVVGIPAANWIGELAGWRLSFALLGGLGFLDLAALAVFLPRGRAESTHAGVGTHPDRRRYLLLVVTTPLVVCASLSAYTYVTAFLIQVSGLSPRTVAPVLLLSGLTGAAGVVVGGLLVDRRPRLVRVGPVALMASCLLSLFALGRWGVAAAALEAAGAFALSALVISLQHRALEVAPGRTDIASAWYSASFNVGIAGGPLVGGLVLGAFGLRATPLAGGILALAALGAAISGEWPGRWGGRTVADDSDRTRPRRLAT